MKIEFIRKLKQAACIFYILFLLTSCSHQTTPVAENTSDDQMAFENMAEEQKDDDLENIAVINAEDSKIDEENILNIIKELSSEKYEGRLAGTKYNQLSAEYFAKYFKEIGLKEPQGLQNYMQTYDFKGIVLKSIPDLKIEDSMGNMQKSFQYSKSFTIRMLPANKDLIDSKAEMYVIKNIDDIRAENVKDKVVIISAEVSKQIRTNDLARMCYSAGSIYTVMEINLGAGSVYSNLCVTQLYNRNMGDGLFNPLLYVDNQSFKELSNAAEKGMVLHFSCESSLNEVKRPANVIGLIEGSDAELKDEYIIIGSHFDHVGNNMNGSYNPGALDNASGTSAMMEIARVMSKSDMRPRKSILFIAFNSEEGGSIPGSYYYVEHPVYPLKNAVMINLDMVGSKAVKTLSVGGSDDFSHELALYARKLGMEVKEGIDGGSDHDVFIEAGINAAMLANEDLKSGYHGPNDTAEDIDKYNLEKIVKCVLSYLDNNAY